MLKRHLVLIQGFCSVKATQNLTLVLVTAGIGLRKYRSGLPEVTLLSRPRATQKRFQIHDTKAIVHLCIAWRGPVHTMQQCFCKLPILGPRLTYFAAKLFLASQEAKRIQRHLQANSSSLGNSEGMLEAILFHRSSCTKPSDWFLNLNWVRKAMQRYSRRAH